MDNTAPQLRFTAFKDFGGVTGNEDWRAAIAATGAGYNPSDLHWYLWKDAEPYPLDTINELFKLARQYDAYVTVELIPAPNQPT